MATELLTYAELATVWGVSREAARKKVEGLRLPKQTGNDGKARIMIDLAEVEHRPLKRKQDRKLPGDRAEAEALRHHVETLQAEVGRLTTLVATNRADFERERERAERAAAELVDLIGRLRQAEQVEAENASEAQAARIEADRAKAELAAWQSRPWWRRAIG